MALNTKKQRIKLYKDTFLNWKPEQIIDTLKQTSEDVSKASGTFKVIATDKAYNKLCESISDLETMIEVFEEMFPTFRNKIDQIKKVKLKKLNKRINE